MYADRYTEHTHTRGCGCRYGRLKMLDRLVLLTLCVAPTRAVPNTVPRPTPSTAHHNKRSLRAECRQRLRYELQRSAAVLCSTDSTAAQPTRIKWGQGRATAYTTPDHTETRQTQRQTTHKRTTQQAQAQAHGR